MLWDSPNVTGVCAALPSTDLGSLTSDLPSGDTLRVLVIDDDDGDGNLVRHWLTDAGMNVDVVTDLDTGAEALRTHLYHAAVVDYQLGIQSGLTVFDIIRDASCPVPVIVLSGKASRERDLVAMRAGAAVFIDKSDMTAAILDGAVRYSVQQARLRLELERQARRDPLTKLHNRASTCERVDQLCGRSLRLKRSFAVGILDLDGFKAVNDHLGHSAGDVVLRTVATRLRGTIRPYDLAGRLGGDEFVLAMEDIDDREEAARIGARIVAAIGEPIPVGNHTPPISASLGLVLCEGVALSATELLAMADSAMYHAKRCGRGRVVVVDSNAPSEPRYAERGLRSAMGAEAAVSAADSAIIPAEPFELVPLPRKWAD